VASRKSWHARWNERKPVMREYCWRLLRHSHWQHRDPSVRTADQIRGVGLAGDFRNQRFAIAAAREPRELMLEEDLERVDERARSCLAHGPARIGTCAAHILLDGVDLGNTRNGFGGNRRIAAFGDLKELAPQVAPSKGDCDPVRRQLLVRSIAVAPRKCIFLDRRRQPIKLLGYSLQLVRNTVHSRNRHDTATRLG
jgi:hypothetical protein